MNAKAHKDRPGRRIGSVGRAFLAAKAVQNEKTKKALKRIAEAGK